MTTKRTLLLSVGALVLCLAIETDRVHACSCTKLDPPCQEAWRAGAVFAGRVVGRTYVVEQRDLIGRMYDIRNFRVRMRVTEAFRGDVKDAVDVFTPASGASCGYDFLVNRSYLVYAYWDEANKRWEAGMCSRTRSLEQASEDLAYLRGPASQPSGLGQLVGTVTRQGPDPADEHRQLWTKPFPNARVLIESVEATSVRKYEARTGLDGQYSARVPVGKYRVTLELPTTLYTWSPAAVELRDARDCASHDFYVRSDGRMPDG